MIDWRIHHKAETASTNRDARAGAHGDVYIADFQTAGRGRLDHKWLSPPGTNLMMSAVLDVGGLSPEAVSTLPLVVGLAVVRAVRSFLSAADARTVALKWPNDVLVGGRKVAGILCERNGDAVIVGIGINVKQRIFPPEIAARAISLAALPSFARSCAAASEMPPYQAGRSNAAASEMPPYHCGDGVGLVGAHLRCARACLPQVRDAVLDALGRLYETWRDKGFAAVFPDVRAVDFLRGQALAVRQTDDDAEPVRGLCGGIQPDGSLHVGETSVYAGEAHVEAIE